jgi:hypothetical protein
MRKIFEIASKENKSRKIAQGFSRTGFGQAGDIARAKGQL